MSWTTSLLVHRSQHRLEGVDEHRARRGAGSSLGRDVARRRRLPRMRSTSGCDDALHIPGVGALVRLAADACVVSSAFVGSGRRCGPRRYDRPSPRRSARARPVVGIRPYMSSSVYSSEVAVRSSTASSTAPRGAESARARSRPDQGRRRARHRTRRPARRGDGQARGGAAADGADTAVRGPVTAVDRGADRSASSGQPSEGVRRLGRVVEQRRRDRRRCRRDRPARRTCWASTMRIDGRAAQHRRCPARRHLGVRRHQRRLQVVGRRRRRPRGRWWRRSASSSA